MRELPEIETIRRALDKEATGKKVKTAEITGPMATFPRHPNKKHLTAKLEGAKITSVARKGLVLLLTLDSADVVVVSLGTGGSLRRTTPKEPVAKGTFLTIAFTQGGQIRFADETGTATVSLVPADELEAEVPELAGGLDLVETPVSWTLFAEMLRGRKAKLKAFLVDQSVVAGMGDLYADEVLFAAGLRPDRVAGSLTTQEIRRLYRALVETLHDAIKYRGTSLEDDEFVDLYGKPGEYADHLKVYRREKASCRRCRVPVAKMRTSGSTTYLCEQCQV